MAVRQESEQSGKTWSAWAAAQGIDIEQLEALRKLLGSKTTFSMPQPLGHQESLPRFVVPAVAFKEHEQLSVVRGDVADKKQQEIEELRLQVERLKSLATQERRAAAYEAQRCDQLLEQLGALRKSYDQLAKIVEQLTSSHQACEYRTVSRQRFDRLAEKWKKETGHLSNMTRRCTHPAYQEIIGMGLGVIPLVLRDLKTSKDDWFWALSAITGENPIVERDAGDVARMTEAWLRWGRAKGYDV